MGPGGTALSCVLLPVDVRRDTSSCPLPPLQVCCESGCDEAVFPLSVSLMDRFLSASLSLPVSPYLLAAGCVLIASKLTESASMAADALCAAAEYSFLSSDLRVSGTGLKYTAVLF